MIKKNLLIGLAGSLLLAGGVMAAVLLAQRQQDIREKAATNCTEQTIMLPATNTGTCPWNVDDNLDRLNGYYQARRSVSKLFTLTGDYNNIVGGRIYTDTLPPEYLYDDFLIITLNNKLTALNGSLLYYFGGTSALGTDYSWGPIAGQESSDNGIYQQATPFCISDALTCEMPSTNQADVQQGLDDINPKIEVGLSAESLKQLLNPTGSSTFSYIVVGDNNPETDCRLNEPLYLTIQYCEETGPTPTPSIPPANEACTISFNVVSPTPTASPTPSPSPTPTVSPTPTPSPAFARCVEIKIYDTNWIQITAAELASLSGDETIKIAVAGSTNTGSFDKALFAINGVSQETTQQRSGTGEFYINYTLPNNTYNYTIDARVHHPTLGWF